MSEGKRLANGVLEKTAVLFSPFVPYEEISHAGGRYLFRHIEFLSQNLEVTLIAFKTAENEYALRMLSLANVSVILIEENGKSVSKFPRLGKIFARFRSRSLVNPQFLKNVLNNSAARAAISAATVCEFLWTEMASCMPLAGQLNPGAPKYVFAVDVISQRYQRRAKNAMKFQTLPLGLYALAQRQLEKSIYTSASRVAVFCEKDKLLVEAMGCKSVQIVYPPRSAFSDGHQLHNHKVAGTWSSSLKAIFVGAMDRVENDSAMRWFLNNVWPMVIRKDPGASLKIVGSKPSAELLHLASQIQNAEVTGWVEKVEPFLLDANVSVAPLFDGAGIKFKVLDALESGLPVVGTAVAFEGIPSSIGTFEVQTAKQMADKILELRGDLTDRATYRADFLRASEEMFSDEGWQVNVRKYYSEIL